MRMTAKASLAARSAPAGSSLDAEDRGGPAVRRGGARGSVRDVANARCSGYSLLIVATFQTLAPGFLIAAPPLGDPNFDRTVVLLAVHGDAGALGFVVNRVAPMAVGELLSIAGYGEGVSDPTPVHVGGPVEPSSGWIVLVDPALAPSDGGVLAVGDRVRVTSSREAFDELARDARAGAAVGGEADPRRRMVVLGYSGWGPGQLEGEIAAGAWLPVPLDERVLFDVALAERWERAYALLGVSPAGMMHMGSGGDA
jgi:putative transcriptional regulator